LFSTLYGIYHLARKSKGRTPASSAGYHFFALFTDAGLIPFYVFTAILANTYYQQAPGSSGRWTSFFDSDNTTTLLIHVTWLVAIANGGMHALSLLLDFYLVIVFRKIANLPPDMNPLEDQLTRRKTKHKHKNSEITLVNDKHLSDISASTIFPNRSSYASDVSSNRKSQISFMDTRATNASNDAYQARDSHRMSHDAQQHLLYQHHSASPSRTDLKHEHNHSHTPSVVSSLHGYAASGAAPSDIGHNENDNWFVIGDGSEAGAPTEPEHHYARQHEPQQYQQPQQQYDVRRGPLPAHLDPRAGAFNTSQVPRSPLRASNPLRMNPPTPPPQPIAARVATSPLTLHMTPEAREEEPLHRAPSLPRFHGDDEEDDDEDEYAHNQRTRTMASVRSAATGSSHYSEAESSGPSVGQEPPRGKFYGDLSSAMRGVRHQTGGVRPQSLAGSVHYAESGEDRAVTSVSGTVVVRKALRARPREDDYSRDRVVSSGVDGMGRRDVSGKVAEEGRAGPRGWFGAGLFRRPSRAM
jgi:hypothetical protein